MEDNTGNHIGYPPESVDVENQGTPVAIDTAGNVDHSTMRGTSLRKSTGNASTWMDFTTGRSSKISASTGDPPESLSVRHFGIVMNNTDPNMHSENIEIRGNIIDGPNSEACS